MEDTMESIDDQDDLEEEAQEEVDKILFEITKGKQWWTSYLCFICVSVMSGTLTAKTSHQFQMQMNFVVRFKINVHNSFR